MVTKVSLLPVGMPAPGSKADSGLLIEDALPTAFDYTSIRRPYRGVQGCIAGALVDPKP